MHLNRFFHDQMKYFKAASEQLQVYWYSSTVVWRRTVYRVIGWMIGWISCQLDVFHYGNADNKPVMYERTFLQDVADQNFSKYHVDRQSSMISQVCVCFFSMKFAKTFTDEYHIANCWWKTFSTYIHQFCIFIIVCLACSDTHYFNVFNWDPLHFYC